MGHASELAEASHVTLRIRARAVPLLGGVIELTPGNRPGGLASNLEYFERGVRAAGEIDQDLLWLLYDPQTSGGLLIVAAAEHARAVDRALTRAGIAAAEIGAAAERGVYSIELV
jgi:selenide,water dikinase